MVLGDDVIQKHVDASIDNPSVSLPFLHKTPSPRAGVSRYHTSNTRPSAKGHGIAVCYDSTDSPIPLPIPLPEPVPPRVVLSPLVSVLTQPHPQPIRYEPPPRLCSVLSAEDKLLLEYAFQMNAAPPEPSIFTEPTADSSPPSPLMHLSANNTPDMVMQGGEAVDFRPYDETISPAVSVHTTHESCGYPDELIMAFHSLQECYTALLLREGAARNTIGPECYIDSSSSGDVMQDGDKVVSMCDVIVGWGPLKDAVAAGCISEAEIRQCYADICSSSSLDAISPHGQMSPSTTRCGDDIVKSMSPINITTGMPTIMQNLTMTLAQFARLVEELQRRIDKYTNLDDQKIDTTNNSSDFTPADVNVASVPPTNILN